VGELKRSTRFSPSDTSQLDSNIAQIDLDDPSRSSGRYGKLPIAVHAVIAVIDPSLFQSVNFG